MKEWLAILIAALFCLCFYPSCYAAEPCPALTGEVITKDNSAYNTSRLNSNYDTSKNKLPNVIVYCKNVQDIQNAIHYAHCQNLPVRVRSGGHNHAGYSTGNNVVLIDVSRMKDISIDQNKQIARVEPGVTGGELYRALYANGLTQAGGTCSGVGISGLILSGGMGPLARKQGMACDSLLAIDLVDAEGQLRHATKDNAHRDLFWASCGGGGNNFGVVTALKLKVYPAETVTWFNIGWDWNQPVEPIISLWQKSFFNNDKRWYSHLDLWAKKFPIQQFHQQPIKVMGIFWGTPDAAKRELSRFLKIGHPTTQIIKKVSWMEAILALEEAMKVYTTAKPEYKSSGAFVMQALPSKAVHILASDLSHADSPFLNVVFFSLGGASDEHASNATAYYYRRAKAFAVYSTQWLKPVNRTGYIHEIDALRNDLLPFTQGDYIGNQDPGIKDYLTAYYGENVHQLQCIKRKYDPTNFFHFEQGIPPASADCV